MGTPLMGDRRLSGGVISRFYSSSAWIEGRAEDQLTHVSTWAGVSKIAAFPDLHPGKHGPVGCAILADRVFPQLIGGDIGCGMSFFQLDLPVRKLKLDKAVRRMRGLDQPLEALQTERLAALGLAEHLFPEALGTIGGGNHFCEVQMIAQRAPGCDLDPSLAYLLVHSGSRGLGTAIINSLPQGAFSGLSGADPYVAQQEQAVTWASLNRQIIAERAAEALRADVQLIADAPHNLLTRRGTGWLHRKGAAVASDLVPLAGSRATPSFLLKATAHEGALASLAHGAGRRYDRSSMHGRVRAKKSDIAAMERNPFGGRVICEDRDLLVEEAPVAYKSAEAVAADLEKAGIAQRIATLHPLLTFKKARLEGGS